jgi:hypothetical protein
MKILYSYSEQSFKLYVLQVLICTNYKIPHLLVCYLYFGYEVINSIHQLFSNCWKSRSSRNPASFFWNLNDTPITAFTTVHYLTMSWAKWFTYYCVHNSPLLDHVLRQMIHLLLCSQQSTTWPCSEPNGTPVTVFTTVHYWTMSWAK